MAEDESIQRIRDLLAGALRENKYEREQVEWVLGSITAVQNGRPSPSARPAPSKRAAKGQREREVLAELARGPGTAGDLASRLGAAASVLYGVLSKLHSARRVTKTGNTYEVPGGLAPGGAAAAQKRAPTPSTPQKGKRKAKGKRAAGGQKRA